MPTEENAKSFYEDLKKKHDEESEGTSFNASHGWFHQNKDRANIHNIKVNDKPASADLVAVQEFPETLWETIGEGSYLFKQVFNAGKTELYWKRMPE